jgi:hypothetical protein
MEIETATLGDALPAEIKRIQAKRERWLGYAKDAGPVASFNPALMMMQMAIDEGVAALASGDVVRMIAAYQTLKDYGDDD